MRHRPLPLLSSLADFEAIPPGPTRRRVAVAASSSTAMPAPQRVQDELCTLQTSGTSQKARGNEIAVEAGMVAEGSER